MAYKVAIDCGHGMFTSGKQSCKLTENLYIDGKLVKKKGSIIKENEFNRLVGTSLGNALKRCGVEVTYVSDMTGKVDVALSTRVTRANQSKADVFISCHYNAIGLCASWQTKCQGLLVLKTINCSSKTHTLCDKIHTELKGNYKHSYGVGYDTKWSGFTLAVLRGTNMPATLIEYGFMDYKAEALKMVDPKWYNKLAEDTCKGICKYFNISYKSPQEEVKKEETTAKKENTFYRVVTGSYLSREGAESERESLKKLGYGAFLIPFVKEGKTYLRVIALSTTVKKEAESVVSKLKTQGYSPFISMYII